MLINQWSLGTVSLETQKNLSNEPVSEPSLSCIEQLTPGEKPGMCRFTLLVDERNNPIIAIFPQTSLLDLNAITKHIGFECKPMIGEALVAFSAKHGLDNVEGWLNFRGLPSVIDQQILGDEVVFLELGIDNQYLQLNEQDVRQLFGDAIIEDVTAPLTELDVPVKSHLDEKQIFDSISQFTELRIKQRLEETLELPPLPSTAQRIIKLRVDPNADIGDLASIVEVDPSLAAQVVSWAASPYYSAPGSIKSIHDAIVRVLGFDMVLNLALGLALGKSLDVPKAGPNGILPYWHQAVHVAAAVESLVTLMPRDERPSIGTAYLAGLLNNFGYLVLMEVFPPHFSTISRHIEANPHVNPGGVDRHILGISRDQLACWLMEYWNMPESVCNALRHQSDPNYDGEDWQYAQLIFLANNLLRHNGVLTGAPLQPIPDSVYKKLGIDKTKAREAIKNTLESNQELSQMAQDLQDSAS